MVTQLLVVLKHALKREQQRWSAASLYACCKRVGKQHGRLLIEVVLSDDSLSALLAAGLMHQVEGG